MLRTDRLCRSFGALEVTRDVSLEVRAGSRHAVIGPNGAGKTTLFKLLAGEIAPSSGRVFMDGADITAQSPDRRARHGLAWSYQRNTLFEGETVRANLLLADIAHRGYGFHSGTVCRATGGPGSGSRRSQHRSAWPTSWRCRFDTCLTAPAASSRSAWRWRPGRACCCWTSRRRA